MQQWRGVYHRRLVSCRTAVTPRPGGGRAGEICWHSSCGRFGSGFSLSLGERVRVHPLDMVWPWMVAWGGVYPSSLGRGAGESCRHSSCGRFGSGFPLSLGERVRVRGAGCTPWPWSGRGWLHGAGPFPLSWEEGQG